MAEYEVGPDGFIVKTDYTDVGVRMKPAADGVVYEHPENVYSDAPLRGDYTGRVQPRVHWRKGRIDIFGEFRVDGRGGGRHG